MTILEWLKTRETKKKLREQNKFLQDQVKMLLETSAKFDATNYDLQLYQSSYAATQYNEIPTFVIEERLKRNLFDQIESNIKIEQREGLGGVRLYFAEITIARRE